MDCEEFVELVAEMRAMQKEYWSRKNPNIEILQESKRLEREVDKAIDVVLNSGLPM